MNRFRKIIQKISTRELGNINFAFVSFDDYRDSPKVMKDYLANFDLPNMHGLLSGKDSGLEVAREYKNQVNHQVDAIKVDPDFQFNHNGFLYLINPKGELAIIYRQQEINEKKLVEDIKKLMKINGNT